MCHGLINVTVAMAAMPSSRPVNPSFSDVVAFTLIRSLSIPMIGGHDGLHGVVVRADLGVFADQRAVGIADAEALRCGKCHGMFQKDMAGGPFPLRIRRREMLADVTLAQRAIDRVSDRVHPHIGVRMALQAAGHAAPCTPHSQT